MAINTISRVVQDYRNDYMTEKDGNRTTVGRRSRRWLAVLALVACCMVPMLGQAQVTVRGSVFGAGKGDSTNVEAARVSHNADVVMKAGAVLGSVYGGGELASVGAIKVSSDGDTTYTDGHTTVTISGGSIGPDNMAMVHKNAAGKVIAADVDSTEVVFDTVTWRVADGSPLPKKPDFIGHVFGGGKGMVGFVKDTNIGGVPHVGNSAIPKLAYVNSTEVNISNKAFVKGSVYGGSENGHVRDTTCVRVSGGQIGAGYDTATRKSLLAYSDTAWRKATTGDTVLAECAHWDYDTATNFPYDMYSGYLAVDTNPDLDTGRVVATDGHTFYGNVFGGGSGYFPYAPGLWLETAGSVGGHTRVEITDGHILTSVYGGNEMTNVGGKCTVVMTGGTVGVPRSKPQEHPVTCNLYGAGKGDQRTAFNQWTNVGSTVVKIGGSARIFGSVFGGGEDGHVLGDANTTIGSDNVVIGTTGASSVDGNVFGGGRGFSATALTAGVVCGNVNLTITGGKMLGSVYGGGRLAAVGTPLVQPKDEDGNDNEEYGAMQDGTDHGKITVVISGGEIGNRDAMALHRDQLDRHDLSIGDVFGGSKGWKREHELQEIGRQRLGLCKNTDVQISGTAKIYGNVYGGGEIASVGNYEYATDSTAKVYNKKYSGYAMKEGDVLRIDTTSTDDVIGLAKINISGGQIGLEGGIDSTSATLPADKRKPGRTVNHKGHVYGGCLGQAGTEFSGFSFVNHSVITISDSAYVVGSVFGGGENGHVLDSTRVVMRGGKVGMEPDSTEYIETNGQGTELYFGNVYGGGRGVDTVANRGGMLSLTAGRVRHSANVHISGGRVTHNVYGGGSLANTGIASDTLSGWARVVVDSVAVIGYDDPALSYNDTTMEYTYSGDDGKKQEHIDTLYARAGRNGGRVYGSARGEASETGSQLTHMAFTKYTSVKVGGRATVRGSVFGGGENGHVRKDTYVYIEDSCRIGVPLQGNDHTENEQGVGPTIYRGNVYGGGRGLDSYSEVVKDSKGDTLKSSDGTDSVRHVFSLTAGRVYGNANIEISGGQIYHHVYGGGSLASVGDTVHIHVTDSMIREWKEKKDTVAMARYPNAGYYDILDSVIVSQYEFYKSDGSKETTAYLPGDPITGTGTIKINVRGGVIGQTGINEGRIYGSGRGIAGDKTSMYTHMAFSNNTEVNISDGADIRGSVFGGGANGHVTQNAKVNVYGGIIGARLTLYDRMIDDNGAPKRSVYRGNVYGGGRGVDPISNTTHLSNTAGRVFGNTEVNVSGGIIRHGVYGGGSLASVGDFFTDTTDYSKPPYNKYYKNYNDTAHVRHYYYEGTGQAHIRIKGGVIGPRIDDKDNDLLYGITGRKLNPTNEKDLDTIRLNYHHIGANEGMVYGSGRGVAYMNDSEHRDYIEMAFTHNTIVEIDSAAYIYGSVFGGGENGHVKEDTRVVLGGKAIVGGPELHGIDPVKIPGMTDKLVLKEEDNEQVEDEHGVGMTVYRGNVYGGGRGVDNSTIGDQKVFSSSAGRVYGNTNVTIRDSAVVRRVVYGGGSVASVGTYVMDIDGITPLRAEKNVHYQRVRDTVADRTDTVRGKEMPTGITHVIIEGGVIGRTGINEGHVYGGGRGIAGNTTDEVTHLAYCDSTYVYITKQSDDTLADIRGSVFGGGANGHVLRNTSVVMDAGIVGTPLHYDERIISSTSSHQRVYRGNLYGGGRGVDPVENSNHLSASAGRVYGNTNVTVRGGVVRHNVYGGGSLASVGTFKNMNNLFQELTEDYYEAAAKNLYISHAYLKGTGEAHVHISGGRIGPMPEDLLYDTTGDSLYSQEIINRNMSRIGENEGQVYGSGRGVAYTPTDTNAAYAEMAFVKETFVTIDSVAYICGSVFGGGENGHVRFDTHVEIMDKCLIGGIPLHDTTGYALKGSRFLQSDYPSKLAKNIFDGEVAKFNIDEDVAVGSLAYKDIVELYELPTGVGRTMYRGNVYGGGRGVDHSGDNDNGYSSSAGRVYGNANIYICGGHILHHVYGGGSIASVGNYEYDSIALDEKVRNPIAPRLAKYGYEYDTTFFDKIPLEGTDSVETPMTSADTIQRPVSGTVNVTVVGGTIGVTGINEGRIYTAGRGIAGTRTDQVVHLAYCNETNLTVSDSADIRGSVFGGGANGHVLNDAHVTITGGDIGWGIKYYDDATGKFSTAKASLSNDTCNLIDYDLEKDMALYIDSNADGSTATIFRGNVYGGGRGVDPAGGGDQLSLTAGRIFGNTHINITGGRVLHNVYGGGSMASVGDTLPCSGEYPCVDIDGNTDTVKGFGQFGDKNGVATINIGGNARIGWNGIDNNGHVFGSCRGEVAANYVSESNPLYRLVTYQYARLAYVRKSVVNISGNAQIMGSVLGGGANGHVEDTAWVQISGGTIGALPDTEQDTIDPRYQFCGNVYGAGRGVDVLSLHFSELAMHAGAVRGNTYVYVTDSATIRRNVYGGGSMGIVGDYGMLGAEDTIIRYNGERTSGDANVYIHGKVGDSTLVAKFYYGGNVFGSSRGKADHGLADTIYDDMAYVYKSNVYIDEGAYVYGSVYGGGENGHVDFGGTYVNVLQGTVRGNVFGGGKGTTGMPTAGVVDGSAHVFIGSENQTENSVIIGGSTIFKGGSVYGGNDAYSSPLDSTVVHIWKTAHNDDNVTSATGNNRENYAIANVFGGGNQASRLKLTSDGKKINLGDTAQIDRPKTVGRIKSYDPTTLACVYIHNCDNTVQRVFGGGNAAEVVGSMVDIDGGRFDTIFAGGNGEVTAANVGDKGTEAVIHGGKVNYLFAGSNKNGTITGSTIAKIDTAGGAKCDFQIDNLFGGGNEAAAGGGEITIGCGTYFEYFYGGANNADINGDIVLNVVGGTFTNLFGGNNKGGTVNGNVTVNVSAGNIENLFGGNNAGGNITGTITVNVDHDYDDTCRDGIRLDYVYGGGKDAAYTPTDTSILSPMVNIINDTITYDVFGGGLGKDAVVNARPHVTLFEGANVRRNVYGGGSAAAVRGSTRVDIQDGTVRGSVFGGGLGRNAKVYGFLPAPDKDKVGTMVDIRGTATIGISVYGGGNAGEVYGTTNVSVGDYDADPTPDPDPEP